MRSVSGACAKGSESQPARALLRFVGGRKHACMRNGFLQVIACTAILGIRPILAQEEPASALIRQMSVAVRQTDYQGSFIYEHNGQIDALRLFHSGATPERERLVSMSGARSEIVRDGGSFT
jgi:sigma-E factor negative regulatory protein RseB